ncbi:MAG: histidinol dehydrogenase, partial [Verrucomicrobiota bacterium]
MSALTFPILQTSRPADAKKLAGLNRRALPSLAIAQKVRSILEDVREGGDRALCAYTKKFDGVALKPGEITLKSQPEDPPAPVRRAISHSLRNIRLFSTGRRPRDWRGTNSEGAIVGEQYRPFERVGVYVPGGTAPLVSTALMTVGVARVAGVKEIAVTTPPPVDNSLHYALRAAGATEIYHAGGAQAIAALAFGTETIPAVQMIAGPGNAYVVEAKRQAVGAVAIDLLPGPSEIAVLADGTANPKFVAADLLAQAEHGPGSQVLMVSPSGKVLARVQKEMNAQLPALSRQAYLRDVLKQGTHFV